MALTFHPSPEERMWIKSKDFIKDFSLVFSAGSLCVCVCVYVCVCVCVWTKDRRIRRKLDTKKTGKETDRKIK